MRITDKTARRGTGSTITLTRKGGTGPHNPAPTTERGKRRAARRGAAAVLDAALALNNAAMLSDLGVTK
jgi:hypothetical protein